MRQHPIAKTVAALESLLGLALVFTAVYIFLDAKKAGELEPVEVFASWILGGGAVLVILSSWGLWKSKAWGWWLAMLMDSAGLITFLWDASERDAWPSPGEVSLIILFVILIVLLMCPPARSFFLRREQRVAGTDAGS